MWFLDIFLKKKSEDSELRREFEAFRQDFVKMQENVSAINRELNTLYQNVRVIAEKGDNSELRHEVRALQAKMKDLMAFARLSLQNHDEIQELKGKIPAEPPKKIVPTIESEGSGAIKEMSPREKEIVGILLNSEIPLSNVEIARHLGISPITAKGHINSIKKRYGGVIISMGGGKSKKEYQLDRAFRLKVLGL